MMVLWVIMVLKICGIYCMQTWGLNSQQIKLLRTKFAPEARKISEMQARRAFH